MPVLHSLRDRRVLDDVLQFNRRVANDLTRLDHQLQREFVRDVGRARLALCAFSSPTTLIVHSRVTRLTCDSSHSIFPKTTHWQCSEPSRSSTKISFLRKADVVRPPLEVDRPVLVLQLLDGDFREREGRFFVQSQTVFCLSVSLEQTVVKKLFRCVVEDFSEL